jgi:hypothetical protein
MAEVLQIQGKDSVVSLGGIYPAVNAIQSFDWEPRFNEENLSELGNAKYSATTNAPEISGSFEMTATGSTVSVLRRMLKSFNAGTGEYLGQVAGATGVSSNAGMVRATDLENCEFDIIESKKPNEVFSRATLLPRMSLSTMSMRADANGMASESYNFEGDLVRIMPTGKHDVAAVPSTRVNATTFQMVGTAHDDIGAAADSTAWVIAFAMIDEVLVPASAIDATATPGEWTVDAPYSAKVGARTVLYVYRRVPGAFPSIVYPTSARFVKANSIDIYLVPKTTIDIETLGAGALNSYVFSAADRFLRAQSMDLSIDLRREALRQIAKSGTANSVYYRACQYPLNVSSSISVMEGTMEDHAKLQGKAVTDILDLEAFEGQTWQIVSRYYYNGAAVQTTAFTDARVSGSGRRIAAAGRGEISWSFTGSNVVFDGAAL